VEEVAVGGCAKASATAVAASGDAAVRGGELCKGEATRAMAGEVAALWLMPGELETRGAERRAGVCGEDVARRC